MRLTDLVTPLKPLEAMAQTCLLAASDVGGHRELIRDGETGFLFEADSVPALAACVTRAFSLSAEKRNTIAQNGLAYVRTERDWSVTVKRYERAYANAIANKRK